MVNDSNGRVSLASVNNCAPSAHRSLICRAYADVRDVGKYRRLVASAFGDARGNMIARN